MKVLQQIEVLRNKSARLVETLLNPPPMIRGSFTTHYVKCGGVNCKCTRGEKHPYNRLTWSENGKVQSRVVPIKHIDWVKEMTQNYRRYKKVKKELDKVDARLKEMMTRFEVDIVGKTRKMRGFS